MKYCRRVENDTSVKTIGVIQEPTARNPGIADFTYRPVFSVFDYGTIQSPVPLDNSTVCLMAGFNFEVLKEAGIESHYQGLVKTNGKIIEARRAAERRYAPVTMRVQFVNRVKPEFVNGNWNYKNFQARTETNYVQPIEFMTRNALPASSSVWKRIAKGELVLEDFGLPASFQKGDAVPQSLRPLLDYSTKFESEDRYLKPEEARALMHIDEIRFKHLNDTTRKASNVMTDYAADRGFVREDGKVEYIANLNEEGKAQDILGDVVCTWHEDRLTWKEFAVSKQLIRDEIKRKSPEWSSEIERAKKQAKNEHHSDFRRLMNPSVQYISPSADFFTAVNTLFQAATNQWVNSRVYPVFTSDSLEHAVDRAVEGLQKVMTK